MTQVRRPLPYRAMMRGLFLALLLTAMPAQAADYTFTTSDGVRLHVIDAGPPGGHTIVLVPGWTMPAWIFQAQLSGLGRAGYHVVALDPRGQGDSDVPDGGYTYTRRGQDVAELIARLPRPVMLVGWSLGVLDSLAYVAQHGDAALAGLVLVDNSIGEEPAPVPSRSPAARGPRLARDEQMRRFVAGMFRSAPDPEYLRRLTEAALRTPPQAAAALGNYAVPRTYWRDAVYSTTRPVLYVVRPKFEAQAMNFAARAPTAETALFSQAGHALFVDEPERFNALVIDFIRRRVWP